MIGKEDIFDQQGISSLLIRKIFLINKDGVSCQPRQRKGYNTRRERRT
jgi:hypothetical protein